VRVFYHILVVTVVAVLPIILWVVARLLAPNYFTLPDRRAKVAVIVIVVVVTLLGYAVGRFNNRFIPVRTSRSPAMIGRRIASTLVTRKRASRSTDKLAYDSDQR
jgi:hypothetical protein